MLTVDIQGKPHRIGMMTILTPIDDPRRVELVTNGFKGGFMPTTRNDFTFKMRVPEEISADGVVRI